MTTAYDVLEEVVDEIMEELAISTYYLNRDLGYKSTLQEVVNDVMSSLELRNEVRKMVYSSEVAI